MYPTVHICFVIDNSPLTFQTMNNNNHVNNTNTNISIMDSIKINIETVITKSLINTVHHLHLFVTSNPNCPLSSFQHDINHFRYQLKQIIPTRTTTFPAQTIKFAIKHITQFRVLSGAETVLGYRQGIIQQSVLMFYFSYGMTIRKISIFQSAHLHKYFRSQDKFIHYRLCYPFQNQKDKTSSQKFRIQLQEKPQYKRLVQISQKINKGQTKNVTKILGNESLSELLTKSITQYVPTLCVSFQFLNQIGNPSFSDYFKNSELKVEHFIGETKVQLAINNKQNSKNNIPFPFEAILKGNQKQIIAGRQYPQIEQVSPICLYVDLGKKLSKQVSMAIQFQKYLVINTNSPKLIKLEKQLQRAGINEMFFPIYSIQTINSKKEYFLIGFLLFLNSQSSTWFEVAITYPNFPYIQSLINTYQTSISETNSIDAKKIYKIMTEYFINIPDFYYPFLNEYFRFMRLQPMKVQILHANNIGRVVKYRQRETINQMLISYRRQQRKNIELFKEQLSISHLNSTATCCVIYADSTTFKQHSFRTSKYNQADNGIAKILKSLVSKINEFNQKIGLKSYFGGKAKEIERPITKQLQRSGQKFFNDRDIIQGSFAIQGNVNNGGSTENPPSKKIKTAKQQEINLKGKNNEQQIKFDDDLDSVMPYKQQLDQQQMLEDNGKTQIQEKQKTNESDSIIQRQNRLLHQHEVKVFQNIYNVNSVAIRPIQDKQNQILEERQESGKHKQPIVQKYALNKQIEPQNTSNSFILNDRTGSNIVRKHYLDNPHKVVKRSSSIDYLSSSDEEEQAQVKPLFSMSLLAKYSNSLCKEKGVKIEINPQNFKEGLFESNLQKLKQIGFLNDISKFLKQN